MKSIERFLKSRWYLLLVFLLAFIGFISSGQYKVINQFIILLFLITFLLLLVFFDNSVYTIPILLASIYSFNQQNTSLSTIHGLNFIHIIPFFLMVSILIHFIRFKPKFKEGILTKPYLWIAIAYIASIFSVNITITYIQLSLVGFIYLLVYQFYRQTIRIDMSYMMMILLAASLLLILEVSYTIFHGFLSYNLDQTLANRILLGMESSWGKNDYGWGNINDVIIHICLLISAQFYFIHKYPEKIYYWGIVLFTGFVVLLSASRVGYVGITLAVVLFVPYHLKHTNPLGRRHFVYILVMILLIVAIISPLIGIAFNLALQGGIDDINNFTSDRLLLYENALRVFIENPIFGAGWEAMVDRVNPDRIQVFHSTIFHTLAVMGLFGMIVLIYYFIQTFKYLTQNQTLVHSMILIGVIASQFIGLFDNSMYMLTYTLVTIALFGMMENIEVKNPSNEIETVYTLV